jgi:putative two-component system response regulator
MESRFEPDPRPSILLVDDDPLVRSLLSWILGLDYQVHVAGSGNEALVRVQAGQVPDLILLDIVMPDLNGYEILKQLQDYPSTRDIPVIFLTSRDQEEDVKLGLDMGAVDYIIKPPSASILLARVRNHLQFKVVRDLLKNKATKLQLELNRRSRELEVTQTAIITTLAYLAENRNGTTVNQTHRIQYFIQMLAEQLRSQPRFASVLNEETVGLLRQAVPLYDIGMISLPDRILLKPGPYTDEELEIMQHHCEMGRAALEMAERELNRSVKLLDMAKEMAYAHHENWDGTGYPQGLKGEEIPLSARIVALVDCYDALIRRRLYKAAMSHDAAMETLAEYRGTRYDPDVVDALVQIQDRFQEITHQFPDTDQDLARMAQRERARRPPG